MNFFDDFEAPPIRKPSISLIFLNILTLIPSTDPPYNTAGLFFLKMFFNIFLMCTVVFFNSVSVGIFPVPIDQIGS